MDKITVSKLEQAHACSAQVERFRALFGEEVEVTVDLAVEHAQTFDWNWAVEHLLSAPGLQAYQQATAQAQQTYDEARAPAWQACDEARAAARRAYQQATATAFVRAYLMEAGND